MPISCHFRDCKVLLVTSLTYVRSAIASTPPLPLPLLNVPSARQRGWLRHCSHLDAAVRQRLGGKRIGLSMPNDWLKISRRSLELSVQTMLFAAGCRGSGNVPCTYSFTVINTFIRSTVAFKSADDKVCPSHRQRTVMQQYHREHGYFRLWSPNVHFGEVKTRNGSFNPVHFTKNIISRLKASTRGALVDNYTTKGEYRVNRTVSSFAFYSPCNATELAFQFSSVVLYAPQVRDTTSLHVVGERQSAVRQHSHFGKWNIGQFTF